MRVYSRCQTGSASGQLTLVTPIFISTNIGASAVLPAFGILRIFAFANAGVSLAGLSLEDLLQPIPLGIMLGLVVGKQVGVFSFAWLAVKLGLARLPSGVDFRQVYGAAIAKPWDEAAWISVIRAIGCGMTLPKRAC